MAFSCSGQPCPDAADQVACGLQPGVEGLDPRRVIGNPPPRVIGGRLELLEPDQTGQIRIHRGFATNKKSPARGLGEGGGSGKWKVKSGK